MRLLKMNSVIDQRDVFLKGNDIVLKALTRQDCINSPWYGWFNDEELCSTLQKHYFPNTLDSQIKFWEDCVSHSNDKIQLGICPTGGESIVGIVSLSDIDYINRKAEFSIVIGNREFQNVHIFTEASRLIFRHGFYSLNLNKIYGGSVSRDLVALLCRLLKCKEEGILRQEVFKNGKYLDVYRYAALRDEYKTST